MIAFVLGFTGRLNSSARAQSSSALHYCVEAWKALVAGSLGSLGMIDSALTRSCVVWIGALMHPLTRCAARRRAASSLHIRKKYVPVRLRTLVDNVCCCRWTCGPVTSAAIPKLKPRGGYLADATRHRDPAECRQLSRIIDLPISDVQLIRPVHTPEKPASRRRAARASGSDQRSRAHRFNKASVTPPLPFRPKRLPDAGCRAETVSRSKTGT
jgi:hypothetical protein